VLILPPNKGGLEMSVYRNIQVNFWQDDFVLELTPEEKFFYMYLLTNSKTTQCGIYSLPIKVAEMETGYNRETVEKLLARFETYNKIKYSKETKEIMILNWLKYNPINNINIQKCVTKELSQIKNIDFVNEFEKRLNGENIPLETPSKPLDMPLASPRKKEEEEEEEEKSKEKKEEGEGEKNQKAKKDIPPPPYHRVVELFNSTCIGLAKVIELTEGRKKKIKARWIQFDGDIDKFEEIFRKISLSTFLNGENERGWKANFDWLFDNDTKFIKVLEGCYDNSRSRNTSKSTSDIPQHHNFEQRDFSNEDFSKYYANGR
jgi:hypothetical protein